MDDLTCPEPVAFGKNRSEFIAGEMHDAALLETEPDATPRIGGRKRHVVCSRERRAPRCWFMIHRSPSPSSTIENTYPPGTVRTGMNRSPSRYPNSRLVD